jgi:acyl-coenzyme A thioesterase PaaI-like protein
MNLHVEYFEPVEGPRFLIESRIGKRRGRTIFVEVTFKDMDGKSLLFATTMLLEQPPGK